MASQEPGPALAASLEELRNFGEETFALRAALGVFLGFGLELSDMDRLVRESNPDIDYIRRNYPLYDIEVGPYTYLTAGSVGVHSKISDRQARINT